MAITRRGKTLTSPRTVKYLGRVLVTIDDLRALRELLVAHGSNEVIFEFLGGVFDDPEDVKSLSDVELTSIVVKAGAAQISLQADQCYVAGPPEMCEVIYNEWARSRRFNWLVPHERKNLTFLLLLVTGFAAVLALSVWASIQRSGWNWWLLVPVVLIAGMLILVAKSARSGNYALVKPMSLDEARKEVVLGNRHRQTVVIALFGVIVALLGVIVALLVQKG